MKKLWMPFALLAVLALAGCGAGAQEEDGPGMEKAHYYQILDAQGDEVCSVFDPVAVAEIDELLNDVGMETGWTGGEAGETLYTYVFWQEETLRAGEDPAGEREYVELLRMTVRADSDVITTEVLSRAADALADLLPQADLGDLLTFSAQAAPETAEALRQIVRSAGNGLEDLTASYYGGQEDRAYKMLQKHIFENLLEGWTAAEMEDLENPVWNYETFTAYEDPALETAPGEALYCCTFSADGGRCGFVVVSYDGDSLSRIRVEETPYLFDLKANLDAVTAALGDADLSAGQAARVRTEEGGEAIRITDESGRRYLCRFDPTGAVVSEAS